MAQFSALEAGGEKNESDTFDWWPRSARLLLLALAVFAGKFVVSLDQKGAKKRVCGCFLLHITSGTIILQSTTLRTTNNNTNNKRRREREFVYHQIISVARGNSRRLRLLSVRLVRERNFLPLKFNE